MSRMPWATYLWPGLPQLWARGLWPAVVLAVGFGAAVDLLLLASWVWVELFDPLHLRLGWLTLGLVWLVSTVATALVTLREPMVEGVPAEALFRSALGEYLQGSWFEAEAILARILRSMPGDVEARLMLATLLRHTGRCDQAREQLDRLEHLRDSERWTVEIDAERRAIRRLADEPFEEPVPSTAQSRHAA